MDKLPNRSGGIRRRPTVELRSIIERERLFVSPPPAPPGTSLREWFAGLALGNPSLMDGIEPACRVAEALRIADELLGALSSPRVPSQESMAAPSAEEMQRWDDHVAQENELRERQGRATIPELRSRPSRTKTLTGVAIPPNPPPGFTPVGQRSSSPPTVKVDGPGRYVVMGPKDGTTNVPPIRRR